MSDCVFDCISPWKYNNANTWQLLLQGRGGGRGGSALLILKGVFTPASLYYLFLDSWKNLLWIVLGSWWWRSTDTKCKKRRKSQQSKKIIDDNKKDIYNGWQIGWAMENSNFVQNPESIVNSLQNKKTHSKKWPTLVRLAKWFSGLPIYLFKQKFIFVQLQSIIWSWHFLAFNSLFDKSNYFYKISKIVHTLWLAERCVCMRVCKHGCDVK